MNSAAREGADAGPVTAWRLEMRDEIAILWLGLPGKKQNILTPAVLMELDAHLERLPAAAAGLIIASEREGSFIAGADISEIDSITDEREGAEKARAGQRIFSRLASLAIPTVAAINGVCLGGGCELALSCTGRVAALGPKTLIGLPETMLGILPGFGGTQRLPRVVGLRNAVDLILSGRALDAPRALRLGLVNRAVAPRLVLATAIELVRSRPRPARPKLGRLDRVMESALLRRVLLGKALAMAEEKAGGHYPAIPAVIDVLRRTAGLAAGRDGVSAAGLEIEAQAFGRLVVTDVSRNLRRLYFLDEGRKKYAPFTSTPRPLRRAGVLGAGVMGGGIAWAFSSRGVPVRVKDIRNEALLGALQSAWAVYSGDVTRRRLKPYAAAQGMARISTGLDFSSFGLADIVVEAVVEKMEVKKKALAELEKAVRPDTVLATNTSGLSIDEMADALERPNRFGGLHFFNPVNRMPLVEIIRGAATDDETVSTLFATAKLLGKKPILVRDAPGFLVNRILIPYMLEAARMLEEGVPTGDVDDAAERFGMPMGPCRLADEVGLDIGLHVAEHLAASFGSRMAVPELLKRLVTEGLLGKKKNGGFYVHSGKRGAKPALNEAVLGMIAAAPRRIPEEAIQERLFLTMLLEAARCLDDGVVATPEDIEIGMIYGTGFPPFRGGLVRWGASVGFDAIQKKAGPLGERFGERYILPSGLKEMLQITDKCQAATLQL